MYFVENLSEEVIIQQFQTKPPSVQGRVAILLLVIMHFLWVRECLLANLHLNQITKF